MGNARGMIFAAGYGTRMGTMTQTIPKPLLRVGGHCLLDHAVEHFAHVGRMPVVVNTFYLADQIEAHCAGLEGVMTEREEVLLDTGGGLKAALPHFADGPLMTMNSDAIFPPVARPSEALQRAWREGMGALLLVSPRKTALAHQGTGDFDMDAEGRLTRAIAGKPAAYVFTGLQIIEPSAVLKIPDRVFSLNRVWNDLLKDGLLFGVVYEGPWVDTGTPAGLRQAEALTDV